MKHEIIRNKELGYLVWVKFEEHVPLEVRDALMAAGFRFNWTDAAWCALDRKDEEIERIINSVEIAPRPQMTKEEEKDLTDEFLRREAANGFAGPDWEKYLRGKIGALVRLTDGSILNIEKPSIETSFCYGESGYDMDDAIRAANRAMTSEDHFRRANLRGLDECIRILERRPTDGYSYRNCVAIDCDRRLTNGITYVTFCSEWNSRRNESVEEVCEEDRERILEGYRKVYASFEKRISTYLKRYGLSKVRAWTYWRDA